MHRSAALMLVALLATSWTSTGCASKSKDEEFAGLGMTDANSDPPPGIYTPIAPGDLRTLQERGQLLYAMERGLRMGYEQGAYKLGVPSGDVIMPLVDIDPGGRSGQVLFVRWPSEAVGEDGAVKPQDARRWLLVTLLLGPDRVMDVQLVDGPVAENEALARRVEAVIVAAEALREEAPGHSFHLFTLPEAMLTDNKRTRAKLVTRVYAMSAEGDGPDLEVVVDAPKRKRPLEVLHTTLVHEAPAAALDTIEVELDQPAPATVARVLMRGPQAGDVPVMAGGRPWVISATDGRVARDEDPA